MKESVKLWGKFALVMLLSASCLNIFAQPDRKYIRQGNQKYRKGQFGESELLYKRSIEKNKENTDAAFNAGSALYRQDKLEEASKFYSENASKVNDTKKKSDNYYNLGNTFLKAGNPSQAINAFKSSLLLNPGNLAAKYNLAYAQDMLKQQEQQKQQNQDQDKKEEQKQDEEKKEDQKQDQDKKEDQKQDQDKKEDQKQDQDKKNDQKEDQDKKDDQQKEQDKKDDQGDKNNSGNDRKEEQNRNQKNNPGEDQKQDNKQEKQGAQQPSMTKADAERLLETLANDEKKVMEKVQKAKGVAVSRPRINW